MKKLRIIILFVVIAVLLSACSASMEPKNSYEYDRVEMADENSGSGSDKAVAPSMPSEEGIADNISGTTYNPANLDTQKLIKNASFEMETTDFEDSLSKIEVSIKNAGGYIQYSNIYGNDANYIRPTGYYNDRSAELTARIPVGDLDSFSDALEDAATVVRNTLSIEEISDYYYDTEARLKSLKVQENTLLDILEKAETLTDVVTLQTALMDVRYQIESTEGTLRRLDNQIAYSTVSIRLVEVKRVSDVSNPETLSERISFEFRKSVNHLKDASEDFIVFIAGNIILISFWLIILTVILIFVRILIRSSQKKSARQNFSQTKIDEFPTEKEESDEKKNS